MCFRMRSVHVQFGISSRSFLSKASFLVSLPPEHEVLGKVMFSVMSVFTGECPCDRSHGTAPAQTMAATSLTCSNLFPCDPPPHSTQPCPQTCPQTCSLGNPRPLDLFKFIYLGTPSADLLASVRLTSD